MQAAARGRRPVRSTGCRPSSCSTSRATGRSQRPHVKGGGWAFQFANDYYPDLDDTAVVAWAMHQAPNAADYAESICRALDWLVGMQSENGGFAAFDADNTSYYLNKIPFADHGALLDPPTSDVSARVVTVLARIGRPQDKQVLERAIAYLRAEQEPDGSWFGRWGTNYVYGTWSVLTAFAQAGIAPEDPAVRRAVGWLKSRQNADGGWGESNDGYKNPRERPERRARLTTPRGRCSACWRRARRPRMPRAARCDHLLRTQQPTVCGAIRPSRLRVSRAFSISSITATAATSRCGRSPAYRTLTRAGITALNVAGVVAALTRGGAALGPVIERRARDMGFWPTAPSCAVSGMGRRGGARAARRLLEAGANRSSAGAWPAVSIPISRRAPSACRARSSPPTAVATPPPLLARELACHRSVSYRRRVADGALLTAAHALETPSPTRRGCTARRAPWRSTWRARRWRKPPPLTACLSWPCA